MDWDTILYWTMVIGGIGAVVVILAAVVMTGAAFANKKSDDG